MKTCDIFISGGGIAGLSAASAFGAAGFQVICADPAPIVSDHQAKGADMRSTALLQPARLLLEEAGVWQSLCAHAAPLQVMRIIDAGGNSDTPRSIKDFDAADISDQPFGWNFPNLTLRAALLAHISNLPNVTFLGGIGTQSVFTRSQSAQVHLSDGSKVQTKLMIGADGRNSPMRKAAGIEVQQKSYGQKALAFSVTHPIPHQNVSTEIHRSGGPFTFVPLPDYQGQPCSAVVWMDEGPLSQARMDLSVKDFEAQMSERSCHHFGPLTLISQRSIWPIISQSANQLYAQRLALIAEAAHVLPPIGAQGLNMSLQDIACLLDLAKASPDQLGDRQMLENFEKIRKRDIKMRMQGIDLLNRASRASNIALRNTRALGLDLLYALPPLRKKLMQMGLGMEKTQETTTTDKTT